MEQTGRPRRDTLAGDEGDFYERLGKRISDLRRNKLELTQRELSDRIALSRTSLANIEKGRQQLLLHHALEIADALEVKLSDVVPPRTRESADRFEERLKGLPAAEKRWIQSSVRAAMHQSRRRTR